MTHSVAGYVRWYSTARHIDVVRDGVMTLVAETTDLLIIEM